MTQALLDGDICCFRCAAVNEEADVESALLVLDRQIQEILYVTEADSYKLYLTGSNNFRKQIYPEYKANRKDKPKPKHLQACRDYLIEHWKAEVSEGCEADDLLGIEQYKIHKYTKLMDPPIHYYKWDVEPEYESVICSIDKDLLQIPGKHYNFVKNEWYDITEQEGYFNFFIQLLQGDKSDNIPGLAKVGPKKALKYLEGCETPIEMYDICRGLYNDDLLMDTFAKCLWIWREKGQIWKPELIGADPLELEMEEQESFSTMQKAVETNQSTEPTMLETNGFQPVGLLMESTVLITSDHH